MKLKGITKGTVVLYDDDFEPPKKYHLVGELSKGSFSVSFVKLIEVNERGEKTVTRIDKAERQHYIDIAQKLSDESDRLHGCTKEFVIEPWN